VTVQEIYDGSDGDATKALYVQLATLGPVGAIAINLLRAQKASSRAKVYRGGIRGQGSYKSMAYERKEWALSLLCTILEQCAPDVGLVYGWQHDDATPGYPWVLYVNLPTGQASFHAPRRGVGPTYVGVWDGVRDVSADRIVRWVQAVLDGPAPAIPRVVAATPDTPSGPLWCDRCACWWAKRPTCPRCLSRLRVKAAPAREPELRPGVRAEWSEPEATA